MFVYFEFKYSEVDLKVRVMEFIIYFRFMIKVYFKSDENIDMKKNKLFWEDKYFNDFIQDIFSNQECIICFLFLGVNYLIFQLLINL